MFCFDFNNTAGRLGETGRKCKHFLHDLSCLTYSPHVIYCIFVALRCSFLLLSSSFTLAFFLLLTSYFPPLLLLLFYSSSPPTFILFFSCFFPPHHLLLSPIYSYFPPFLCFHQARRTGSIKPGTFKWNRSNSNSIISIDDQEHKEDFTIIEYFCILADSQGSVRTACLKLRSREYRSEIHFVCRNDCLDVKSLLLTIDGAEDFLAAEFERERDELML